MPMNPISAASAYANAAKLAGAAGQKAQIGAGVQDLGGFADMVGAAIDKVAATGNAAETRAVDVAAGNTDVVELVTAVAETELAVEALVTVRDRVIAAYQEILNMPI